KQAAGRLGHGIGDKIVSAEGTRSYTVVGLVEFPSRLREMVLFAPDVDVTASGVELSDSSWLVSTRAPITWDDIKKLNTAGIGVASREVFINPPPEYEVPSPVTGNVRPKDLAFGVLVGGLALLEVVLLAGPAFAVSARRRQRQLALVAANGGTGAHIRRMV